jgi:hypothetical protein
MAVSNVQRLVILKTSRDAIPDGGGLPDAIAFLSDPQKIVSRLRESEAWVREAIALIKSSPDNPFGDDDEAIAGEILRQIEEKKKSFRESPP